MAKQLLTLTAPTLGGRFPLETHWATELLKLQRNWNGCDSPPISRKAIVAVGDIAVFPSYDGGVHLELRSGIWYVGIYIDPRGKIENVVMTRTRP